jgi:hypothetical protein
MKLYRNDLFLYKNCSNGSSLLNKMEAKEKSRKKKVLKNPVTQMFYAFMP